MEDQTDPTPEETPDTQEHKDPVEDWLNGATALDPPYEGGWRLLTGPADYDKWHADRRGYYGGPPDEYPAYVNEIATFSEEATYEYLYINQIDGMLAELRKAKGEPAEQAGWIAKHPVTLEPVVVVPREWFDAATKEPLRFRLESNENGTRLIDLVSGRADDSTIVSATVEVSTEKEDTFVTALIRLELHDIDVRGPVFYSNRPDAPEVARLEISVDPSDDGTRPVATLDAQVVTVPGDGEEPKVIEDVVRCAFAVPGYLLTTPRDGEEGFTTADAAGLDNTPAVSLTFWEEPTREPGTYVAGEPMKPGTVAYVQGNKAYPFRDADGNTYPRVLRENNLQLSTNEGAQETDPAILMTATQLPNLDGGGIPRPSTLPQFPVTVSEQEPALTWADTEEGGRVAPYPGHEWAEYVVYQSGNGFWCYYFNYSAVTGGADTKEAAVAACERHFKTGQWDETTGKAEAQKNPLYWYTPGIDLETVAQAGEGEYFVKRHAAIGSWGYFFRSTVTGNATKQRFKPTKETAIADCERHYKSGKWEDERTDSDTANTGA